MNGENEIYNGIKIDIQNATSLEIANEIVKILDSKKARNIKLLKVRERTVIADYFVLCTGTSSTQVRSLAAEVDFYFGEADFAPLHKDQSEDGTWSVLDFGVVMLHVFSNEAREFYNLEKLWEKADEVTPDNESEMK